MVVYVFERINVYDGFEDTTIRVYADLEKATQILKEQIEMVKEEFEECDYDAENYVEGDMSWTIWEEGEFCMNHVSLTIYEREVE